MYRLIDYYTGKRVDMVDYQSEKQALWAKQEYLRRKIKDKEVHNNLIIIRKVEDKQVGTYF